MNITLQIDGQPVTLENVARQKDGIAFSLDGKPYAFRSQRLPDGSYVLERQVAAGVWRRMSVTSQQGRNVRHIQLGALEANISERAAAAAQVEQAELSPRAPMPGLVRQILVKVGDRVTRGQALAVMEAMKLQITLAAGGAAKVEAVLAREGEMVAEGAELVRLVAL